MVHIAFSPLLDDVTRLNSTRAPSSKQRARNLNSAPHLQRLTNGRTTMPICIECRYPVKTLYTEYSKADDRTLGKGVRLTQCPRCKKFADKYVEHDFVVLFIDLVLIKPQVLLPWLFTIKPRSQQ